MSGTLVDTLSSAECVVIDSAALIYFIEEHPRYLDVVEPVFQLIDEGLLGGLLSTLSLLEVLVKPLQDGKIELAQQYRTLLTESRGFSLVPVDQKIAETGAEIRARYNYKTPDAILLATAAQSGADAFLTNDDRLKSFEQIQVLVVDDFSAPPSEPPDHVE